MVLIPAADTVKHKKVIRLEVTTLIFSNEEIDNILKIVKSLEASCF